MNSEEYSDAGPPIFDEKEVRSIIDKSVESVLGTATFDTDKINGWTDLIVETALKGLASSNKPFKYIVTCVIMQKTGASLHTSSCSFWDAHSDSVCSVRWENATMHCLINAYALRI